MPRNFMSNQPMDPRYDIVKLLPGFETKPVARMCLNRRIGVLQRGTSENQAAASILAACRPKAMCRTPACPICMGYFRRAFVHQLLRQYESLPHLLFVTIVPVEGVVPAGQLKDFRIKPFLGTTGQRIRRAGLPGIAVTGYTDFTFGEAAEVWRVHLHLIVAGTSKEALQRALERHYESYPGVYRPMLIKAVYDRPRVFSYVAKSFWQRKVTYLTPAGEKRSRSLPLKPAQERELLTYLAQHRISDLAITVRTAENQYDDERPKKERNHALTRYGRSELVARPYEEVSRQADRSHLSRHPAPCRGVQRGTVCASRRQWPS